MQSECPGIFPAEYRVLIGPGWSFCRWFTTKSDSSGDRPKREFPGFSCWELTSYTPSLLKRVFVRFQITTQEATLVEFFIKVRNILFFLAALLSFAHQSLFWTQVVGWYKEIHHGQRLFTTTTQPAGRARPALCELGLGNPACVTNFRLISNGRLETDMVHSYRDTVFRRTRGRQERTTTMRTTRTTPTSITTFRWLPDSLSRETNRSRLCPQNGNVGTRGAIRVRVPSRVRLRAPNRSGVPLHDTSISWVCI